MTQADDINLNALLYTGTSSDVGLIVALSVVLVLTLIIALMIIIMMMITYFIKRKRKLGKLLAIAFLPCIANVGHTNSSSCCIYDLHNKIKHNALTTTIELIKLVSLNKTWPVLIMH